MAKKSQQEALMGRGPPPPEPWEGVGGGDKSPPRGVETRRVEKKRAETRYTTLNHPSPEGWWDFFNFFPLGPPQWAPPWGGTQGGRDFIF